MSQRTTSPNYHPLVRGVARALRARCAVTGEATIVIGCSGGADSVALVRALATLAGRRRWPIHLVVAHVQHHLRGDEAERDAAFVGRLAVDLGLGFERCDIRPADEPGNFESAARKLRYRALVGVAERRGAGFVATAHHADDQLETLLMRLLRGSGVNGLRGIAWRRRLRSADAARRVYAIRPMLGVERADVLAYLDALGQRWCEDATNADTARTRARIRHEVIPLLKAIRGDAAGKAVALTDHFDQLHQLVQDQVDALPGDETLDELPRDRARAMNPIVLTQLLRRDLIAAGVGADHLPGHALHPVVQAVRDRVGGVRRFEFAGGVRIEVGPGTVRAVKPGD